MSYIEGERLYLLGRYNQAFEQFSKDNCAKSLYYLGVCYLNGRGVEADLDRAKEYFLQSYSGLIKEAYSGDSVSQLFLGNYYYNEQMCGKCDFERAAIWFEASAQRGNYTAKFNLANCLIEGIGVEGDTERAAELFGEVASNGSMEAIYNLAVYLEGSMAGEDISDALALYLMASEMGSERAMYALGQSYIKGRSVLENREKGIEWLKKAAEKEFYPAIIALSELNVDVTKDCDRDVIERPADYVDPYAVRSTKKRKGLR